MLNNILVFLLGLCLGSFLNVCIYRIPRGLSVVFGLSGCPNCGSGIRGVDLSPVLGYVLLKGRCRNCRAAINPRYPLVELLTAVLFLASYHSWGACYYTVAVWIFLSALVVAAFIDLEHGIIPDQVVVAALVLGVPVLFLASPYKLISGLTGFAAAGIIMLVIALLAPGGMGGGDVKLSAVIGLYLGWPNVLAGLFLAFLSGGLVGIVLLCSGRKKRKDHVPFGPYLALGGVTGIFAADRLINWYMTLF
ncbi:peptidase A24A domain protein [Desulfofarcimen acetoxidans DSM 771]|uniref:Prepilin leader peptidase/N-methyltransferase n=1 Tax=Desulfofarcimen acetoxidans (strain ATCC 49208 / DSM 771 / KCTC 5769 / VKM B-1644 / 5575) TaxID=485916 RepID=C8W149_DESAS|nr:A24 family peptidase [Desulfofarcimen acetoxidans]ACV63445.1 peptidase A24A domain protein [Desulfofarcimen acetoxidans DSM 771]